MKVLVGLITALSIPLMILNMLGGIVSGIWLAILGEWGAVGTGILLFFISTWLLSFALIPSLLFAAPAAYCADKGKTFGLVCFGALTSIYTLGLVTVWCCSILFLFVKDATVSSLIPRLIWSYGVATGPWTYMASKDQGEGGEGFASTMAVFLAELAYLVIIFLVLFGPVSLPGAIRVFGGFMAVGLVIQLTLVVMIQRERVNAGYGRSSIGSPDAQSAPVSEGWWVTARRYAGGFFIYLVYWVTLFGAIRNSIGYTLSGKDARRLIEEGVIESVSEYGWGDHYVWFVIVFSLATFCSAALTGATAKRSGHIIASVANIPVFAMAVLLCYFQYTRGVGSGSPIAWGVAFPLSALSSIVFAFLGGKYGEQIQTGEFRDSTILGIRPFHWFYLWIIGGGYVTCVAAAVIPLLMFTNFSNLSPLSVIPFVLLWLPVLAYGYPAYLLYGILSGNVLARRNVLMRIPAFLGTYVGGLILGGVVQWVCYSILTWLYGSR
jgi:hypothetical protein